MLVERVERMKDLLASIQPRLPEAIAAYQEKLSARLREALGGADEERVRQEIALFGVKADVAEELSRLARALEEVSRVVTAGGTVGKRLDFLMQELNREANTLGSKSVVEGALRSESRVQAPDRADARADPEYRMNEPLKNEPASS